MPRLVGRPKPTQDSAEERAVENSRYVAQLYVKRRKVWEGRAANEDEAYARAKQEKAKYPNSRAHIVVNEAKQNNGQLREY